MLLIFILREMFLSNVYLNNSKTNTFLYKKRKLDKVYIHLVKGKDFTSSGILIFNFTPIPNDINRIFSDVNSNVYI